MNIILIFFPVVSGTENTAVQDQGSYLSYWMKNAHSAGDKN